MVISTGAPALIIIIMRRGRSIARTNSSSVLEGTNFLPAFAETKSSVV
jgi:hypothetical protein